MFRDICDVFGSWGGVLSICDGIFGLVDSVFGTVDLASGIVCLAFRTVSTVGRARAKNEIQNCGSL